MQRFYFKKAVGMATSSFIWVPLKKTVEVDLAKPVCKYIALYYKKSDRVENAANELNRLRADALLGDGDKHTDKGLDILFRYYDQLNALDGRLPLTQSQISVQFKWRDAFVKDSLFGSSRNLLTITSNFGVVEKAAVLFNMAALMSEMAAKGPLVTDEQLKAAARLWQQSAAVFIQLKDHVLSLVPQHPLTPDLLPPTLTALSALMIAQAQEAFYIKAVNDNMKPTLIAKIASQTSDLYVEAQNLMNNNNVTEKVQLEKEWTSNVNGKILMYRSLAQYYCSLEHKENKEIGEELSRLEEASRLWQQASIYLQNANISKYFLEEGENIQKTHDLAKKDNDFIYHEKITDLKSLQSIGRTPLARPLPISSPMNAEFHDIFEFLQRKDDSGGLLGKLSKSIFG